MKKHSSLSPDTVHLLGPGKIKIINGRLAFSTGSGTPARLDPRRLDSVICYGNVGISDDAFDILFRNDVDVSWLNRRGDIFKGRLTRSNTRTTKLRQLQHKVLGTGDGRLWVAKHFVRQKIESQVAAARHYQRHGKKQAKTYIQQAEKLLAEARHATSAMELRGLEGATSRSWFTLFSSLLAPPWKFSKRVRRPPTDPVNALLSLGYTWLCRKTIARIETVGLEVNLGGLHEFRAGRPSLACDMIEPLRVPIVDRWVLTLCNRKIVTTTNFERRGDQPGVYLKRPQFSALLMAWEQRWADKDIDQLLTQTIQGFITSLGDFRSNRKRRKSSPQNGGPGDLLGND